VVGGTCNGQKDDGEPCRAAPLRDGSYCLMHDPQRAEVVAEGRRLGGLRRRREATVAAAYDFDGLASPQQIRRLLEVAALDTLGLENNLNRSRTLAYIGQTAARLLQVGELDEQVRQIIAALGPRMVKRKRQ
jgi:hypothetical protein